MTIQYTQKGRYQNISVRVTKAKEREILADLKRRGFSSRQAWFDRAIELYLSWNP